ncbi:MAG TPA: homoserine kinase [Euzebya sp.]|nr:homoserine kinase [Euzebya sp.]
MGVAAEQLRILTAHAWAANGQDAAPAPDATGVPAASVGVAVPATSANLGPGYDVFGVALDVSLVAIAVPREDRRVLPHGLGGAELPTGDDNLVWQAVLAWCAFAGTRMPDISIMVDSAIPLQRGMGSSSAAAVAGLLLGRALTGGQGSSTQLLGLAADLEGHPDNVAAAISGGLVACDDRGGFQRVTPTASLQPVVLVPTQRQSTSEARAALPTQVPLAIAAANAGRAAATFAGLAGVVSLRTIDMTDQLHEPARLALMPTSKALVEALRDGDIPCALSGAGPSVLAVIPAGDPLTMRRLTDVIVQALADPTAVEVVPTAWNLAGATVRRAPSTVIPRDRALPRQQPGSLSS